MNEIPRVMVSAFADTPSGAGTPLAWPPSLIFFGQRSQASRVRPANRMPTRIRSPVELACHRQHCCTRSPVRFGHLNVHHGIGTRCRTTSAVSYAFLTCRSIGHDACQDIHSARPFCQASQGTFDATW